MAKGNGSKIGEVYYAVTLSAKNSVKNLEKEIEGIDVSTPIKKEVEKGLKGIKAPKIDTSRLNFGKSLSAGISKTASGMHTSLIKSGQKFNRWAKRGLFAGMGAIAATLGTALKKGWDRAVSINSSEASLKGLGFSVEQIGEVRKSALDSVSGTAFGLADAFKVSQTALASGVKEGASLTKYLSLTADAATIANSSLSEMGSIMNKAQSKGTVDAEIMNQLSDRGLGVKSWLMEDLGMDSEAFAKAMRGGMITTENLFTTLQKRLGGAAQKSGDTIKGSIENAAAAQGRFGAAILTSSGLLEVIQPLNKEFISFWDTLSAKIGPALEAFASSWLPKIEPKLEGLGEKAANFVLSLKDMTAEIRPVLGQIASESWATLSGILQSYSSIIQQLLPIIGSFLGLLSKNPTLVANIVAGLIAFKVAMGAVGSAVVMWTTISKVATAAQWLWNASLLANPITWIVLGIIALIAVVVLLVMNWDKVSAAVGGFFNDAKAWIADAASAVGDWFKDIWSAVSGFFSRTWGSVAGWFSTTWNDITSKVSGFFNGLKQWASDAATSVKDFFTGTASAIGDAFLRAWSSIVNWFSTTWDTVSTKVSGFFTSLKQWIVDGATTVKTFFTNLASEIKNVFFSIWAGIISWFSTLVTNISTIVTSVITTVSTFVMGLVNNFVNGIKIVVESIASIVNSVVTFIITLWDTVSASVLAFFTNLGQWAAEGYAAILAFFTNLGSTISGVFENIWTNISNWFTTVFTNISTSVTTVITNVGTFVTGMVDNVVNAFQAVGNFIIGIVNTAINGLNGIISALNGIHFTTPDWVPGIGGQSFGINLPLAPTVPALATGADIMGPTVALIGEKDPETVVNRGKMNALMDTVTKQLQGQGGGQQTFNFVIETQPGMSPEAIAEAVAQRASWDSLR